MAKTTRSSRPVKKAKRSGKPKKTRRDATGRADVVVAGHVCFDIIPTLMSSGGSPGELIRPGALVLAGPAVVSTGGAVSNTGLALHRLGIPVRLLGKVGDDLIGEAILSILRRHGPHLADDMIVARGEASSYSVVINPPGVDRTFLHCPGTNDTFAAKDVPYARLRGARIFHFGYPPLMRGMYADGGRGLARMLRRVRSLGPAVSLDMSQPDVASDAGRADWPTILKRVLPHVDLYLPSLDETLLMLDRPAFLRMQQGGPAADGATLSRLSGELIEMGAAVVCLKLGDQGLYLRTTCDARRLAAVGGHLGLDRPAWRGRELLAPCWRVKVAGTTGSGDCTIAGFLAALLAGLGPDEAVSAAVAVGACSVEQMDSTSGVPTWAAVRRRMAGRWGRCRSALPLEGWSRDASSGALRGPNDRAGEQGNERHRC